MRDINEFDTPLGQRVYTLFQTKQRHLCYVLYYICIYCIYMYVYNVVKCKPPWLGYLSRGVSAELKEDKYTL